jgi:transcriptional regulator with XRE-family HTH domain
MSQTTLAEKIGVTFQQVQKYEKGTNRIGSSRLAQIAAVLGTSPASLFGEGEAGDPAASRSLEMTAIEEMMATADGAALNRSFVKIADPKVKRAVIALVKALGAESDEDPGSSRIRGDADVE